MEDVIESFRALEDHVGTISLPDLQTIYLGLGFLPTRFATLSNLAKEVQESANTNNEDDDVLRRDNLDDTRVSLRQTLDLLSKHERKDLQEVSKATFALWDVQQKGYLEAEDIVAMSMQQQQKHGIQPLSEKQSLRLLRHFGGQDRFDLDSFERIVMGSSSLTNAISEK